MGKSVWYKWCDEFVDYWLLVKWKLIFVYFIFFGNDLIDFEESGVMFFCDKNLVYMRMEFIIYLGIVFYCWVFFIFKDVENCDVLLCFVLNVN